MIACQRELRVLEPPPPDRLEIGATKLTEPIEKPRQWPVSKALELRIAIVGFEGLGFTELENQLGTRHPIGLFTMNQVADNVECAPRSRAFIDRMPGVTASSKETAEHIGCSPQHIERLWQIKFVVIHSYTVTEGLSDA